MQAPLRELGPDPVSKQTIVIKDGRYGPYCTVGETIASLPKGSKVEKFTLAEAARMLAERRESAPAKKKKKAPRKTKAKSEAE